MSNADGGRIAPVTYLFGAQPSGAQSRAQPSSREQPSDRVQEGERVAASPSAVAEPRMPALVAREPAEAAPETAPETVSERVERPRKGSFASINTVSMQALARRGMSSREMHDYLIGRDFEQHEVDREVERLESVALLDDAAFAETLVRTLRDRKGLGHSGLTAELRRRNLDPTAIEIAVAGVDDDELERAVEIAHKRASQLRSYDGETAKRRLHAFLQRKGYSGSVVSTAVQRALAPTEPTFR